MYLKKQTKKTITKDKMFARFIVCFEVQRSAEAWRTRMPVTEYEL